jgi:poly(A)-specific ribonuclease
MDLVLEFGEGFGQYDANNLANHHKAGYDAFMTGFCYVRLAHFIGAIQEPPVSPVFPNHSIILPFVNRLPLVKTDATLNLIGPDGKKCS